MMNRKKRFQGDEYGSDFVDFLPREEFENLSEEVRNDLLSFQRYSVNRRRQQKGIEKLEKKLKPLLKELKERKKKLKSHRKNERKYFNRVSYLKKKFVPTITIYEKDESSKSYKSKKDFHFKRETYGGEKLKKRIVLYTQIKLYHDSDFGYIQKNIYLGNEERVRKICGEILNEDLTDLRKNVFYGRIRRVLLPYIQKHSKEGFEQFVDGEHPFHGRIVKWCREHKDLYQKE